MISSSQFATAMCRALELDMSRIRAITVRLEVDKPVVVDIERHMTEPEGDAIASLFSSYVLVDKADG